MGDLKGDVGRHINKVSTGLTAEKLRQPKTLSLLYGWRLRDYGGPTLKCHGNYDGGAKIDDRQRP